LPGFSIAWFSELQRAHPALIRLVLTDGEASIIGRGFRFLLPLDPRMSGIAAFRKQRIPEIVAGCCSSLTLIPRERISRHESTGYALLSTRFC